MKKSQYIAALSIIASLAACANSGNAFAQSNSEELIPPLIYIVLDTSGSMNESIEDGQNNTRLTKALAEIAGGVKSDSGTIERGTCNADNTSCMNSHQFNATFPVWTKDGSTWKYVNSNKVISGDAKVAIPRKGYNNDGIIQAYKDTVKFGAAGTAVGSMGSSSDKDSSVIQEAVKLGGGQVDGILRSSIMWNDVNNVNCRSDLDFHAVVYRNGNAVDIIDYNHKKGSGSGQKDTGGVLDVDVIDPNRNKISLPGYKNYLGIENITWDNVNGFQVNDEIYFFINPFGQYNKNGNPDCTTKGFRADIAFPDENGCKVKYSLNYKFDITPGEFHGKNGQGYGYIYDFPLAKVTYLGKVGDKAKFKVSNIGDFGVGHAAIELLPDPVGGSGKPEYMYGFTTYDVGGVVNGRNLKDKEYKNPKDCTLDVGMWDKDINAAAPLYYPTPSNSKDDIQDSNDKLVDVIRSYRATSATPLGETLADLYYMFGADSSDFSSVDKGLVKRMTSDRGLITDNAYKCREKAVILITDGEPNGSGVKDDNKGDKHGYSKQIWYDARHLWKDYNNNIKTYVIAYAFGDKAGEDITDQDPADKNTKAYILNMTAWQGGTCRNPVTKKIIDPDKKSDFEDMLKNDTFEHRRCFYNASNSDALRKAMAEAMSDALQGTISKTAVATSTAVGYVKNTDESGKYSNGFYNVYSGYQIKPGLIRRTMLQREATICNRTKGEFEAGKQHLDMSTLLSCRLNQECLNAEGTEAIRIAKDLNGTSINSPCAKTDRNVSAKPDNENTCLNARYIFAGDYSEDRYAINPDNVALNHVATDHALGYVKNALGAGDTDSFNFVTDSVDTETPRTLRDYVSKDVAEEDYILSPYECGSDLDCIKDGKEGYCDLGRCVKSDDYKKQELICNSTDVDRFGRICIAGRWRTKGSECTSHTTGEDNCLKKGKVCHAGFCVDGVLKKGNVSQFLATMPLGTVEYANPVVVEPPTRDIRSRSYEIFSKANWNRDNMLMVAANDGMLHAFILGQNQERSSYDVDSSVKGLVPSLSLKEGDELWSFVPKTTMPKLKELTKLGQQSFLNATPVVADAPDASDVWHTVILGGFGNGGRGYYALDITDPLSPKVLWEIDNEWQAAEHPTVYPSMFDSASFVPGSGTDDVARFKENAAAIRPNENNMNGYPFADLGYASAKPLITRMLVNNKLETVAVLPGGKHGSNKEGFGAIYIVRLFPDKDAKNLLIASIYTKYDVTGAPAVFPNNFNATARRLYFGDSAGNFYALDVSNFNPANWKQGSYPSNLSMTENQMNFLKPAFGPECKHISGSYPPITYKPAVSALDNRTIQVVFGTGDSADLTTSDSEHNYVAMLYDTYTNGSYKLMDQTAAEKSKLYVFNPDKDVKAGDKNFDSNACGNKTRISIVDKGLDNKPFEKTQKMSGSAITYNYVTYFPTYISGKESANEYEKLCKVGNAAIYRISPTTKTHNKFASTDVYNTANSSNFMKELAAKGYGNLADGTKIYGLEMTGQQLCIGEKKTTLVAPRLIAQTGVDAATLTGDEGRLKDVNTDLANFALNLDAMQPTVKPVSWASVYE